MHTSRLPLLLSALALLCACSQRTFVFVSITQAPAATRAIDARVTFSGSPMRDAQRTLIDPLDGFSVEIPAGATGPFSADLLARDPASCIIAQGRGEVAITGPGRTDLTIALSPLDSPVCQGGPITVVKKNFGGGIVTSDPPGLSCGTICTASFPKGTKVRLLSAPDSQSYLLRHGGACSGATCTVTADAPQTVEVHLGARPCDQLRPTRPPVCLDSPLPAGAADFYSIWGSSGQDIWAVGDGGTVWHYDGLSWSHVPQPSRVFLSGVWGSGPDDVWIVGLRSTILHWDGQRLSADAVPAEAGPSATFTTVWGSGKDDVWIAGGTILHREGGKWVVRNKDSMNTPVPNLINALWGSAPNDLWGAGDGGSLWHWDGSVWQRSPSPTQTTLQSLSGLGPNEIWAAGPGSASPMTMQPNLIFKDSGAWKLKNSKAPVAPYRSIWARSSAEVWAVDGNSATIWRWNNTDWVSEPLPPLLPRGGGLWGDKDNIWLATSGGTLVRRSAAGAWEAVAGQSGALIGVYPIADQVWAVGDYGQVLRRDARGWTTINPPSATAPTYYGVWGATQYDLWLVGSGASVLRWNGTQLTNVTDPLVQVNMYAVFGTSRDNIYLAGFKGAILQWDGSKLSPVGSGTTKDLHGVWASGPGDVWAVGDGGTILHRGAGEMSFSAVNSNVSADLYAITGLDGSTAWATGNSGTVLRWDGKSWSAMQLPAYILMRVGQLRGVAAAAKDDVWVVGSSGALLHWNGSDWAYQQSGAVNSWIWGAAVKDGTLWAVGNYGAVLRAGP